jgi:methionine synthase II (cobalamin-independent)
MSELPIHKVKINTISIHELIPEDSIPLEELIENLMKMYESLAKTYKNITLEVDYSDASATIDVYGYIEMTEAQIERRRKNINELHTMQYNEFLTAKEKFLKEVRI